MSCSFKPLLHYSEDLERASLIDDSEISMPPRRRRSGRKRKTVRKGKKRGVRVTKGKINLKVAGYGNHHFSASQLVPFIPLSKLRVAAKRVLSKSGVRKTRKGRRRRKSRK